MYSQASKRGSCSRLACTTPLPVRAFALQRTIHPSGYRIHLLQTGAKGATEKLTTSCSTLSRPSFDRSCTSSSCPDTEGEPPRAPTLRNQERIRCLWPAPGRPLHRTQGKCCPGRTRRCAQLHDTFCSCRVVHLNHLQHALCTGTGTRGVTYRMLSAAWSLQLPGTACLEAVMLCFCICCIAVRAATEPVCH